MLSLFIASLILIAGIVATFLVASDRRDRRERVERAELLQRIQAPQAAIHEHHYRAETPAGPPPGSGLPMTDAQMAELQGGPGADADAEKQRLIAWMEAVENGTAQIEDGVIQ